MTQLLEKPIDWYVERLKKKEYFSLVGYSDAEWFCILGERLGEKTGLGQIIDKKHGWKLLDVLLRRGTRFAPYLGRSNFLLSVPKCLTKGQKRDYFHDGPIEDFLTYLKIETTIYERDMITDDLAKESGLFPFIQQLQKMDVVVIGNKQLKLDFLSPKLHIKIASPNLHIEEEGIEQTVEKAINYGKSSVYLVSAGVSAAIIIDQLHNKIPDSFFIDCGSIWDAFVGIGGQREWRAELYNDQELWNKWKEENIYGKCAD